MKQANASMAFNNYHEKFRQIGTNPYLYKRWVDSNALIKAVRRLKELMYRISREVFDGGSFEEQLFFDFTEVCQIVGSGGSTVVGVCGICDWVNPRSNEMVEEEDNDEVRNRPRMYDERYDIDVLEIKFVDQLSNAHRLQLLVYCALYALENDSDCKGMLYNARTGEAKVCFLNRAVALLFLTEISEFKANGGGA